MSSAIPNHLALSVVRTLPLPEEAKETFCRAASLVKQWSVGTSSVGEWLDQHYAEDVLRKKDRRKLRDDLAYELRLLRHNAPTYWRRLAMRQAKLGQRKQVLNALKEQSVNEARLRGRRLIGRRPVTRSQAGAKVGEKRVTAGNVHHVWHHEDEQYRRQRQELRANWKAATEEKERALDRVERLRRAVQDIAEAEYPIVLADHAEHSRRLVGIAALLVWPEPLPMLGEFGRWAWESKPDLVRNADPSSSMDDVCRIMSQPPAQDGPHKVGLHICHARVQGREETVFIRMPGKPLKFEQSFPLDDFLGALRLAVTALEGSGDVADQRAPGITEAAAASEDRTREPVAPHRVPNGTSNFLSRCIQMALNQYRRAVDGDSALAQGPMRRIWPRAKDTAAARGEQIAKRDTWERYVRKGLQHDRNGEPRGPTS